MAYLLIGIRSPVPFHQGSTLEVWREGANLLSRTLNLLE